MAMCFAGGNLGFETAAFKLTQEFLNIMGGSVDTESFDYFSELVSRAFLLARDHMDIVMSLVSGMADSGLPCFLFPDTLSKVRIVYWSLSISRMSCTPPFCSSPTDFDRMTARSRLAATCVRRHWLRQTA
jgi:hypothetical protein